MERFSKITPIKPQSLTNVVVDQLTDSIVNGDLSDGELLPSEHKLCEIFGVSRNILREAVKILASKGLLEVKQGQGTYVCRPKEDIPEEALSNYLKTNQFSFLQLSEVRAALEIETASLAAQRRKATHLAIMERSLQIMRDPTQDLETLIKADDDFHQAVVDATGNPIFRILIRPLLKHLNHIRRVTIGYFGITEAIFQEHQAIYEAIKSKDPALAAASTRIQADTNLKNVKEVLRKYSDSDMKL